MRRRILAAPLILLSAPGWALAGEPGPLDRLAEEYVKLALALGELDPGYVDAYYGPPAWQEEARSHRKSLDQVGKGASALLSQLAKVSPPAEELVRLRHDYLTHQAQALEARVQILQGRKLSFDEESRALYDAVSPSFPDSHYDSILAQVAHALPGEGSLGDRYAALRQRFVIPVERLEVVFARALDECRKRTRARIPLPEGESFRIEYVQGQSWGAYNWYKGKLQSLIQVNTDLPIHVDRAIDLACHEGYPGHHVYNALLESNLVKKRGWVEFTVYPLYSPQSLIAEGSANYGTDLAFPADERLAFDTAVLFPLAGLDPSSAATYYRVQDLMEQLAYAGNDIARNYLAGTLTADQAKARMRKYQLQTPERAAQSLRFIDTYRSYVVNYNLGEDLVRKHVESKAGDDTRKRWEVFARLISSPRLPSTLD